ncbi:MAG TPA: Hsp70 family protein, partial [Promineifilum sp.]|nr:Hsp70 family protein [Promineifilum sp.]
AKLEQLTEDLVQRSIEPCRKALKDAGLSTGGITEVILVGGMTRMPAIQEAVRKFFAREPHKGVNPDEVVALGAAIQAGVLGGDVKEVVLLDVTPLTLGIETLGGVATPLIERNTTIPTKKSQVFSTAGDSQTQVEIHVVQGERPMAGDNKSLGRFILDGLPPAPRGVPQIEVSFDIDANGILNVSARDKATNRQQAMQIIPSSGLAKDEIDRMMRDAESHAADDTRRKQEVEARNVADSAVYGAEKFLQDNGDKIPESDRTAVQSQIDAVKSAMAGGDVNGMQQSAERLQQALQQAGTAMYQAGGNGATAGAGPESDPTDGGQSDEDVVEGEFSDAN